MYYTTYYKPLCYAHTVSMNVLYQTSWGLCTGSVLFLRQTSSLVYDVWESSHSVSLEGCFAIQMSDRRGAAGRKWRKETDGELNVTDHFSVIWEPIFPVKTPTCTCKHVHMDRMSTYSQSHNGYTWFIVLVFI